MSDLTNFIKYILKTPFRKIKDTYAEFKSVKATNIKEFFKLFRRPKVVQDVLIIFLILELSYENFTKRPNKPFIFLIFILLFIVWIWKKWIGGEWR